MRRRRRLRMNVAPREDRFLPAVMLTIASVVMFTGVDTCAKWLVEAGLPPTEVVFVRYFTHLFIVCALFLPQSGIHLLRTQSLGLEVARGLALLCGTLLNFIAVQYLPLTLTAALFFTIPLWVTALAGPLLGETVGWRRWSAIVVGFCGVLIVTRPWSADLHWSIACALGAALSIACYTMLTRRLAGADSVETQQFYVAAVALIGVTPFAVGEWRWPATEIDWTMFAAVGFFGWLGHQLMTLSLRFAPASALAPFSYAQIIFMSTSSWLIFHNPPDIWVLVGALVVVSSGLYIWLRERQLSRIKTALDATAAAAPAAPDRSKHRA